MVRLALDGWAFDEADARIADSTAILDQRDGIDTLAAANDLDPPSDLETAYEAAGTAADLTAAADLAAGTEGSLEAVVAAATAAVAPRDWLTTLGLSGKDPDADLAAARSAWEAGNLTEATERASLVSGTLAVAADAGRGRAIVIGGALGFVLVLLAVFVLASIVRVRRRRRQTPAAVAAAAGAPSPVDPFATTTSVEPPGPPPPPAR